MYVGKPTDYYDFEPGGRLAWYEQNLGYDPGTYVLSGDTTIKLQYFPKSSPKFGNASPVYFVVTSLTDHKMVLTDGPFPSTATSGYLGEIMTFSR